MPEPLKLCPKRRPENIPRVRHVQSCFVGQSSTRNFNAYLLAESTDRTQGYASER